MRRTHQPTLAANLGGIWSALHRGVALAISDDEVHYLRSVALCCDDDLVSQLLLKKLQIADIVPEDALGGHIVAMNSFVEFSVDGGSRRLGQLVHPSSLPSSYGLSVDSLEGAGLIGMRSGQRILWPTLLGSLRDLQVLNVEPPPRRSTRAAEI